MAYNVIRTPARHSPYPWKVLAEVRLDQGRISDAIENYELAIDRNGPPDVYESLARLHWQRGQYERAVSTIEDGGDNFDDDHIFLPTVAQMHRLMGQKKKAKQTVNRCKSRGIPRLANECEAIEAELSDS